MFNFNLLVDIGYNTLYIIDIKVIKDIYAYLGITLIPLLKSKLVYSYNNAIRDKLIIYIITSIINLGDYYKSLFLILIINYK